MIRILFVCHGNICRSTMAEFLFKDMVKKKDIADNFYIESAGTSSEEEGNPVHRGTKRILSQLGIDCSKKRARQITMQDYNNFDYIICMDSYNKINLMHLFDYDSKNKIHLLMEYTDTLKDVADPWYSGNFEQTYVDIKVGLEGFLKYLNY